MTFIYFVLVLGITVFIHELGHFIFAKRAGIYIYEFSLGMGPRIFKFNRPNDETEYSIRLFPIGGYVSMSGEEVEIDESVPKEKRFQSKTWIQKFLTIVAGVLFNFILAIVLLFIVGLVVGSPQNTPIIDSLDEEYPTYSTELKPGDEIVKVNNKKIRSVDRLMMELQLNSGKDLTFEVIDKNNNVKTVELEPKKIEENGKEVYKYGFSIDNTITRGILPSVKFAFVKTGNLIEQMVIIVTSLVTGQLKLNALAGPIGIYGIVGETARTGLINIVYLIAFLSINVGFINIMPFPAFDGGRLLFLVVEKIKGSPINAKVENVVHNIGFSLLILLMLVVTYNDILRLFK
ncbi:MAG: RIP metalloprotease RseP [Bacilli bacterium]|nr:RIP metalloprotease RseP [Bacilli bacterium]MDD4282598.1 RIP metalloprotease RseP [Bacilli bacterium]MDD4719229.1 RIP metalloprotease RseP [Bacilli bacterium]